jgi:hypothetical protein
MEREKRGGGIMGLLITPSILNSADWLVDCPDSWKTRAFQGLKDALQRVFTSTKATEEGIYFENMIYSALEKDPKATHHDPTIAHFMEVCRGGDFQAKYTKDVKVDGETYTLYGKLDVDLPEIVLDIKTTGTYKKGKYLATPQHLIYCLITGKEEFKYHVAEWKRDPSTGEFLLDKDGHHVPGNYFIEEFMVDDWTELKKDIASRIKKFRRVLVDYDIEELYLEWFVKNRRK